MFVPATRRVVMAPAHAQPGSGSVVERDDLVVGIDERHNRGEDGGPRARVKPGSAVAQIVRALTALVIFHIQCRREIFKGVASARCHSALLRRSSAP